MIAIAILAVSVTSAGAAEAPRYDGSLDFPDIKGPTEPEEYPFRVELGSQETLTQLSEIEAEVTWEGSFAVETIDAMPARDNTGKAVPATLRVESPDIVVEIVHHQPSDPESGGAPFAYPVTAGEPFTPGPGSVTVITPSFAEAERLIIEANPGAKTESRPTPRCKVPHLTGGSLRGAKNKLRAAHCAIGEVHLATGATAGKGKVVRQFRAVGTELAAGARVAVKLGSG